MSHQQKSSSRKLIHSPILTLLFLLLLVFMLCYVWVYNRTNTLYQQVAELKTQETEIRSQNRELQVQVEQLSRSDRIKKIATEQIGLVVPVPETLAVVIDVSWAE